MTSYVYLQGILIEISNLFKIKEQLVAFFKVLTKDGIEVVCAYYGEKAKKILALQKKTKIVIEGVLTRLNKKQELIVYVKKIENYTYQKTIEVSSINENYLEEMIEKDLKKEEYKQKWKKK